MSKIICDVCGTAFPENTAQCPICGSAKPLSNDVLSTDESTNSYNAVKGGRFSKSNVRKRNKAMMVNQVNPKPMAKNKNHEDVPNEGRGLVIAVIVLLIAILAVAAYIFFRFFAPTLLQPKDTQPTKPSESSTTLPTEATIPCTDLTISAAIVELDKVGRAQLLTITASPENTTDEITFVSSNPEIAAILPEGRIVAIGQGEAVITITCGDIVKECRVYCNFDGSLSVPTEPDVSDPTEPTTAPTTEPTTEPTTAPTEPTTPPTTAPVSKIKLNRYDFTLFSAGSGHTLYAGEIDKADVKFYSANESVATFINGRVTAVGPGKTTVYAEYNGEKQSCIVRCNFKVEETTPPTTEETTPPTTEETQPAETPEETVYVIAINGMIQTSTSVTFPLDEEFTITLVDEDSQAVTVTWTSSDAGVCEISGNTVTAKVEGSTTLSTTYNEKTYSIEIKVEAGEDQDVAG